jgi:hypothetical protein
MYTEVRGVSGRIAQLRDFALDVEHSARRLMITIAGGADSGYISDMQPYATRRHGTW